MSVLRMKSPALILPAFFLLAAFGLAKAQSGTGAGSFGTVAIGQTGPTLPVTLTFSSAGTVATQRALADGAENQDFTIASGGSCATGQSYPAGGSCTVSVTFAPIYPGLRRGAVVLQDASGDALASTLRLRGRLGTAGRLSVSDNAARDSFQTRHRYGQGYRRRWQR